MQRAKLLLSAGFLFAAAAPSLLAQGFDGVIQFVSYENHADHPDTMTQMTKGDKVRIEGMGRRGGAMIMSGTSRIIVMPEQKQYMELPADFGGRAAATEAAKHHGVAVKTGKTETVAGIPCEDWHYKGTDDEGKTQEGDVCVAKGAGLMLGRLTGVAAHMFEEGGQAFNDALKNGGGLMKATNNGKVAFEAVKAQATSLPDAMFAPPADYTKMDASMMGRPPHKP